MHSTKSPDKLYLEMKLDNTDNVKEYLVKACIANSEDNPVIERLTGGVSSSVWKIVWDNNRWVMKQALEKLDVEADWFSDVERIHREHKVMAALYNVMPKGTIPKVLYVDYSDHIYAMTCASDEAQTWKDLLMKEDFSITVAQNAALLLQEIHHNSNNIDAENKAAFQDQKYFTQLRVDPFHRSLMQKYPELTSSIQKLIDEVTLQKTCLVHGDFSPKNMLVEKSSNIVLIDFEVAHWGNPVFDIAYCIAHLLLKGWYLKKFKKIFKLIEAFLTAYGKEVNNLMPHLGLMLLARMDGKSPVNYIKDESTKDVIRKVAIQWIKGEVGDISTLQNIKNVFQIN